MDKKGVISNNNNNIRTIITNAVCGEATETFKTVVYITADEKEPSKILGCTIKNTEISESSFDAISPKKMDITVNGKFEAHVWYEASGDTKVAKNIIQFSEKIQLDDIEDNKYYNKHVLAWINKSPDIIKNSIVYKDGKAAIAVEVEYEIGVEVIGEARLNIVSCCTDKTKHIQKDKEVIFDSILTEKACAFNDELEDLKK